MSDSPPSQWAASFITLRQLFCDERQPHPDLRLLVVVSEDHDYARHALAGPPQGLWRGYHPVLNDHEVVVGRHRHRFHVWGRKQDFSSIGDLLKQADQCLREIPKRDLLKSVGEFSVELGWLGLLEHLAWTERAGPLLKTVHATWHDDALVMLDKQNREISRATDCFDDSPVSYYFSDLQSDLMTSSIVALDHLLAAAGVLSSALVVEPQNIFRRDGKIWEVRFGDERGVFSKSRGIEILHMLLQSPNPVRPLSVLWLADDTLTEAEIAAMSESPSFQEGLDKESIRALQQRLREIDNEIEDANRRCADSEVEELESERERIRRQLQLDLGLAGRERPLGPASAVHSARNSVAQALKRAYKDFATANPPLVALARHFQDSIRSEQNAFAYRPKNQIAWVLQR